MIIEWQSGVFGQRSTYQQSTVWNSSVVTIAAAVVASASILLQPLYQRVFQPIYQTPMTDETLDTEEYKP